MVSVVVVVVEDVAQQEQLSVAEQAPREVWEVMTELADEWETGTAVVKMIFPLRLEFWVVQMVPDREPVVGRGSSEVAWQLLVWLLYTQPCWLMKDESRAVENVNKIK